MIKVRSKLLMFGREIIKILQDYGFDAYFVGGSVRDLLLNRPIEDIDIATSALPEDVQHIFEKVIPVGIEHGTVIVRYKGMSFEVTTFRIDGYYSDKRHPDSVHFIDHIHQDLKRRDFTMNAIAMDRFGNIIDPHNGRRDLEKNLIRTVGDGYERFSEDPLRILRALRFSSELGFTIEEKTLLAMAQLKKELQSIAIERKMHECQRLFAGRYVGLALSYLVRTEIYKHLPILRQHPKLVHKLKEQIKPLPSLSEVFVLWALLESSVTIQECVLAWRCSNKVKYDATTLHHAVQTYKQQTIDAWFVYQLTPKFFPSFLRVLDIYEPKHQVTLQHLHELYDRLPIQSRKQLAINGNDLLQLFPNVERGPWIKESLETIEKLIVLEKIPNKKSAIKQWLKAHPPSTTNR